MRRIIGTIGATLAIVVVMATSAGLAEAHSHREATKILKDPTADNVDTYASVSSFHSTGANVGLADGSVRFVTWSAAILPFIEQENLYRMSGGVNSSMGDGSVRFIAQGITAQTWWNADSPSDGQALGSDW